MKEISNIYKIELNIKYAPIHYLLNPGNQLTTFTNELIFSINSDTSELNYDIEVFGSAFNTRLPPLFFAKQKKEKLYVSRIRSWSWRHRHG